MRPWGTCRSKLTVLGATASGRYGSLSAVPSMVSRPCSSQQATRSPPVAMTRLTQNLPSDSSEGAKKPEPSRTTMSPRWAVPRSPRSARITSPGCRAGCMEAEGTVKGWTTKWRTRPAAASSSTTQTAAATTGWGRRRPVSLSRVMPGSGVGALLPDAGLLAGQAAQVVELGAAHIAAGDDLDLVDGRGVDGEHALHADAEGDLADTEGLAHAVALAAHDVALEDLDARAVALDDLHVDLDVVAGAEVGQVVAQRRLVDRKSTRLNSSHVANSYAVFCLKKKNKIFMMQVEYIGQYLCIS